MRRLIPIFVLFITMITLISCGGDDGPTGNGTPDPEITSLQPESGPPGTSVTIRGTGFQPEGEMSVLFGESLATIASATQDEIQTNVPEGISTGSVQVSVTVNEETASGPNFTVEAKAPGISSV
ncbi:IPT/TIG domain-containing protein [Fodinibius sp. AD559]|uniref:IPT/TIG domain-containing protein n=1 Tax=Fodinibius sp. AD559 TaxID=3424179 RepID=UPI004046E9F4